MESERLSPRNVSSRRRIEYRRSAWSVHEWSVAGAGGAVCRAAVLRMPGSALVWAGAAPPRLAELAVGLPAGGGALGSPLLGGGSAAPLARRLAAALHSVVYVSCGDSFDRFTLPLVERALLTLLKNDTHSKQ